jgi:hypothetical protein
MRQEKPWKSGASRPQYPEGPFAAGQFGTCVAAKPRYSAGEAKTGRRQSQPLSLAMDGRFDVTKDTEYLLQLEKPTDNMGAAILFGSKYDSTPAERFYFCTCGRFSSRRRRFHVGHQSWIRI